MIEPMLNAHNETTMKSIQWKCSLFSQLDTEQLFDLIKLRIDIFVVEQNCPYPELDEKDRHHQTLHMLGFNNEQLICCSRLLAPGVSYPDVSIGRFAVAEPYRNQGIGTELMSQCLFHIQHHWPEHNIRVSAQQYLCQFYTSFGFTQTSDMYLEDDIPHIEMLKQAPHDTNIHVNK